MMVDINLLDKLGLYEIDWIPYQKVIKLKNNNYTILVKQNDTWEWYSEKDFNNIEVDDNIKNELKQILKPINGFVEKE